MTIKRLLAIVTATTAVFAAACNVSFFPAATGGGADSQTPAPDGIDPDHPNVERRTRQVDFEDVQTLRVNIPTGRVTIQGQLVRTLYSGGQGAGSHSVRWDARDNSGREVTSGIYIYRLEAGLNVTSRKMILLK